jgi:hypothetical protein
MFENANSSRHDMAGKMLIRRSATIPSSLLCYIISYVYLPVTSNHDQEHLVSLDHHKYHNTVWEEDQEY